MLFNRELRKLGYIIPKSVDYNYLKYLVDIGSIPIVKTISYDVLEFTTLTKTVLWPSSFTNPIRQYSISSIPIDLIASLSNSDIKFLLYKIKIGYSILKDIDRTIKHYTINKSINCIIH